MDLLSSIMKNMTKPPQLINSAQRAAAAKAEKAAKDSAAAKLNSFRTKITKQIQEFILQLNNDPQTTEESTPADQTDPNSTTPTTTAIIDTLELPPMNKYGRTIVYNILEELDPGNKELIEAKSFGQEEIDRHIVISKKGVRLNNKGQPTDQELQEEAEDEYNDERKTDKKNKGKKEAPKYLEKYSKHFVGDNNSGLLLIGKDGAKSCTTLVDGGGGEVRSYGMVSAAHKQDKRTIEETLADIRSAKRIKLQGQEEEDSSSNSTTTDKKKS